MTTTSRSVSGLPAGRRAAVALLCAIAMTPIAAAWGGGRNIPDTVWVTNRDQGTVAVHDASTLEVLAGPTVVGAGVHDIAVSDRTGKVFVSDDASRVYVLSTSNLALEPIDTIQFAAGSRPHHLSVSHDGKAVFVGLFAGNAIAAIDARTHEVFELPSSNQPGTTAHAPEPSPDDRYVFVPHEGATQHLVTKVSLRSGAPVDALAIGTNTSPSEVLPTRNGETLYASMRNEGAIRAIDIDSFTLVGGPLTVGTQPESLILTPGERTLIVSLRGSPARLAFVDTRSMTLAKTLDIAGAGSFGNLAVESADGRYIYATFDAAAEGFGGLVKVDAFARTIVDTHVYAEAGRPHGVTFVRGERVRR